MRFQSFELRCGYRAVKWAGAYAVSFIALGSAASAPLEFEGYAYPITAVARGPCTPVAINDKGQIAGSIYKNGLERHYRGFVTGPRGLGAIELSLGGVDSSATDVNNLGQVVGTARDESGYFKAYVTSPDGKDIKVIETPGPAPYAIGINDRGQVVGGYACGENGTSTCSFITNSSSTEFRTLESVSGASAAAVDINQSGQVTGLLGSDKPSGRARSFITGPDGYGMTALDSQFAYALYAEEINDSGVITGTMYLENDSATKQQFITSPNGENVRGLGALGKNPSSFSDGWGVNNRGYSVGQSTYGFAKPRVAATLTDPKGHMVSLNRHIKNLPAGVELYSAHAINRYGQIAAVGSDHACYIVCPNKNCRN